MTGLQRRVEAIAGLVGWSDPRIAVLLPALAHYHAVYTRHLTRLIASKTAPLPAPGALLSLKKRGDLRVVGSLCGDAIDRKHVLWARDKVPKDGCVTVIEVLARGPTPLKPSPRTGSLGSSGSPSSSGPTAAASTPGPSAPSPCPRQAPRSRASAPRPRRVGPLLPRPRAPWHRDSNKPPVLLYALDRLDPVYIRLR